MVELQPIDGSAAHEEGLLASRPIDRDQLYRLGPACAPHALQDCEVLSSLAPRDSGSVPDQNTSAFGLVSGLTVLACPEGNSLPGASTQVTSILAVTTGALPCVNFSLRSWTSRPRG